MYRTSSTGMWGAIRDVALSPNLTIILVFVIILIVIGITISHSGLLQVHTNAVEISVADRERNILRQQIEYIKLHHEGLESSIPKPKGYDAWRGKCIVNAVVTEYIEWITLNHLTNVAPYVEIKQDRIISIVHSLTIKDEYHSEEFEEFIRQDVKNCISKLVQIRNIYKRGGKLL